MLARRLSSLRAFRLSSLRALALSPATTAFLIFGLINNILYVVILSAAADLAGHALPKSTILLADILPALLVKLSAPSFFHLCSYRLRIYTLVALAVLGIHIVASGQSLPVKLAGIVLASISSGIGEVSFLQLCHFYPDSALAGWGAGTGLAGLLGAYTYLVLTTFAELSIPHTLRLLSVPPLLIVPTIDPPGLHPPRLLLHPPSCELPQTSIRARIHHIQPFLPFLKNTPTSSPFHDPPLSRLLFRIHNKPGSVRLFSSALTKSDPVLLFPLDKMPFTSYRDAYPTYQTIYQLGVLISRSSILYFKLQKLYIPSLLQFLTLSLLVTHALTQFIPSIWIIFFITFWEGLLGGLTYVNALQKVLDTVPLHQREFSVGTVVIGDGLGIVFAGLFSLWLEPALCNWQVERGILFCLY
ncbi:Protein BTN1 [Neolecta irregularis DAH-3]|uniref:Protein BTN n=1 Tax=Neolecta irregularis (strain DAH-3) TaxID=1198029 RepID=A0A1U7LTE4_NEOID|nr:Protein BTN1 [Neolecta irregularis DAH-3]|eukprot:OLL25945.1 Protein BTN1 [Neolecta irregularis DAH-3]